MCRLIVDLVQRFINDITNYEFIKRLVYKQIDSRF